MNPPAPQLARIARTPAFIEPLEVRRLLAIQVPMDAEYWFAAISYQFDATSGWGSSVGVQCFTRPEKGKLQVTANMNFDTFNVVTGSNLGFGYGDVNISTLTIDSKLASVRLAGTSEILDWSTAEMVTVSLDLTLTASGALNTVNYFHVENDGSTGLVVEGAYQTRPMSGRMVAKWLTPPFAVDPTFPNYPTILNQAQFDTLEIQKAGSNAIRSQSVSPAAAEALMKMPPPKTFGDAPITTSDSVEYAADGGGWNEPIFFYAYLSTDPQAYPMQFRYDLNFDDPLETYIGVGATSDDGGPPLLTYSMAPDGSAANMTVDALVFGFEAYRTGPGIVPYGYVETHIDLTWAKGSKIAQFHEYTRISDNSGTKYHWRSQDFYDATVTGYLTTDQPGFESLNTFTGGVTKSSVTDVIVPAKRGKPVNNLSAPLSPSDRWSNMAADPLDFHKEREDGRLVTGLLDAR